MVVKAATTSGFGEALLTMLLFGLGTVPALLLLGLSSSALSLKMRLLGDRIAALSVMGMGAILVFKGGRALLRMVMGA
jgi:sulfite exporter TauE/SafE